PAADLNASNPNPPEKLHLGPLFDNHLGGGKSPWNFPGSVNDNWTRRIEVAAQSAFDNGARATHTAAAQIALGRDIDLAFGANRAAKVGRDLVIAQIDMSAT